MLTSPTEAGSYDPKVLELELRVSDRSATRIGG